MKHLVVPFVVVLTALSMPLAGCGGVGFDPSSKIKGLRVLAVQKEVPEVTNDMGLPDAYGVPGRSIHLKMLYVDQKAAPDNPRPVQILWLGDEWPFQCFNPPADSYGNCFRVWAAQQAAGPPLDAGSPELPEGGLPDTADDATAASDGAADAGTPDTEPLDGRAPEAGAPDGSVPMPEADLTSSYIIHIPVMVGDHPLVRHVEGANADYGLAFAFFAVCAGKLQFVPHPEPGRLPITCVDPTDETRELGPDDFVAGYTAIYVYDPNDPTRPVQNHNPVITEFQLDGKPLDGVPHFPRCTTSDCPTHDVKAMIDRTLTDELDQGAVSPEGKPYGEQSWVAFYATGGSFDHDLRLVNDATTTWNDDNGTAWHVPSEPGPVRIWAIVHDNRGGVAWTSATVIID